MMIHLNLTGEEKAALRIERFNHPHPRVQLRMDIVLLRSFLSREEVARITQVDLKTVTAYVNTYKEGGIEALKTLNFHIPKSELANYETQIEDYFKDHPPSSINHAITEIENLTGIKRGPTQVRKFLKGIKMKRLKIGILPAKGDPVKQEAFKKKSLNPF